MKPRALASILPKSNTRSIVLMTGARQTGKTTLARKEYSELRYLNFDAIENREKAALIHSDEWAKTVGPAAIDEAQKWPAVF